MNSKITARMAFAAALLALAVVAPTAIAGKGNGKGSGANTDTPSASVTVDQAGPYRFGQAITVTTDSRSTRTAPARMSG
jgi:hypothetical protein